MNFVLLLMFLIFLILLILVVYIIYMNKMSGFENSTTDDGDNEFEQLKKIVKS